MSTATAEWPDALVLGETKRSLAVEIDGQMHTAVVALNIPGVPAEKIAQTLTATYELMACAQSLAVLAQRASGLSHAQLVEALTLQGEAAQFALDTANGRHG